MTTRDPQPEGAARVARAVTRMLPAGPIRDRYQQEFLADLHGLDRTARIRYTLGLVSRAPALRAAVRTPGTTADRPTITAVSKPLLCRTGLSHRWRVHRNPDGEHYRRCDRCGLDRYDGMNRPTNTGNTAANMAANLIGRPQ